MLRSAPGQRAAVSTFLGFLKARYSIELAAHQSTAHRQAHVREKLGAKLAEIASSSRRDADARHLWDVTALRYFHYLKNPMPMRFLKPQHVRFRQMVTNCKLIRRLFGCPTHHGDEDAAASTPNLRPTRHNVHATALLRLQLCADIAPTTNRWTSASLVSVSSTGRGWRLGYTAKFMPVGLGL